jgi:hypothetical protein
MKRILMLAMALALATAAEAQLYKYTDPKTGKTVYTDQPPTDQDSKTLNIRTPSGPATKSAVEQDKALDKGRKKVVEDAKKSDEKEKRAAAQAEQCKAARQNHEIYTQGGRSSKMNDKGERELLTDEEIESKRESSRRQMEEACKS